MNNLIFDGVEVSKKEFYESKKAVNLSSFDVNKIAVSNKIKKNNETSKVFIGYRSNITDIVTPLCIILPEMSGWIKNFKNDRKNISFKIEDDSVYLKYNETWNKIKELFKFHGQPIYDDS